MGLTMETWLDNCFPPTTNPSPSHRSKNFKLHVKNKQELRHVEIINGVVYSQAHLPKVGAIPPSQFEGTHV
jgi:hypothetical protein